MGYKIFFKYEDSGFITSEKETVIGALLNLFKILIFNNGAKVIKEDYFRDKERREEDCMRNWPNDIGEFIKAKKPKYLSIDNWIKEKNIPYKFGMGGYREGELNKAGFYKD